MYVMQESTFETLDEATRCRERISRRQDMNAVLERACIYKIIHGLMINCMSRLI